MPRIRHQFNQFGRHRLIVDDVIGEWAMYEHVAECNGYIAFTQYYGSTERVVKIEEVTDGVVLEDGVFPVMEPHAKGMGSWDPR
jgi:hypothetical protein